MKQSLEKYAEIDSKNHENDLNERYEIAVKNKSLIMLVHLLFNC